MADQPAVVKEVPKPNTVPGEVLGQKALDPAQFWARPKIEEPRVGAYIRSESAYVATDFSRSDLDKAMLAREMYGIARNETLASDLITNLRKPNLKELQNTVDNLTPERLKDLMSYIKVENFEFDVNKKGQLSIYNTDLKLGIALFPNQKARVVEQDSTGNFINSDNERQAEKVLSSFGKIIQGGNEEFYTNARPEQKSPAYEAMLKELSEAQSGAKSGKKPKGN